MNLRPTKVLEEFKEFALKGNVIDLAVGIIVGGAFSGLVRSLVDNILMPPLGWLVGQVDFSKFALRIPTPGKDDVEITYGLFLNALIAFVIQAFAIFLVVQAINAARREKEDRATNPATPTPPPAANPDLTTEERLLTEIRDLLKPDRPANATAAAPAGPPTGS